MARSTSSSKGTCRRRGSGTRRSGWRRARSPRRRTGTAGAWQSGGLSRGRSYPCLMSSADTAMAGPVSMVVALQGGERIHYLDWPGAGPGRPVVLVHGLARTAWTWLPVARRLATHLPVVAPDLRGHGASDAPLQGYDLERLALDVLTVMAGKGWGEAVGGRSRGRRRARPGGHAGRRDGAPGARLRGRAGARRWWLGGAHGGHPHVAHAARGGHGRATRGHGQHGRLAGRPACLRPGQLGCRPGDRSAGAGHREACRPRRPGDAELRDPPHGRGHVRVSTARVARAA